VKLLLVNAVSTLFFFPSAVQLLQLLRLAVLHRLRHAGHGDAQTGTAPLPPLPPLPLTPRSWKTWKSHGILKWLNGFRKSHEMCYIHMFIHTEFDIINMFIEYVISGYTVCFGILIVSLI